MKKQELVVASRTSETIAIEARDTDDRKQDLFAYVLMHSVTEAFKDPKVAADYERWKAARCAEETGDDSP